MGEIKKYTLSREVEANRDILSTRISRRSAIVACMIFILIITSVPVVQLVLRGFPKGWSDDELRSSCYMEHTLTSHYQQLLTAILHSGNEKAIIGQEKGWLFYTPDVEHLMLPIDMQSVECILDMKRQLDARGIQLMVLPTPLKPMICAHQLSHHFAQGEMLVHPEYRSWRERLQREGVMVVDAMQTLYALNQRTAAFLRTDTHWSPEGMKAVATLLADTIRTTVPIAQSEAYRTMHGTLSHRGDIYSMLRLAKEIEWLPMERVACETVVDAAGLLHGRKKEADILLLGDSFTNIYSVATMGWGHVGGLAEQLSLLLQCPVDVISRNDDGSFATRHMLRDAMAKGEDRLHGKRVVIWQFAMRELSTGHWLPIPFEVGEPSENLQFLTVEDGEMLTVEATVAHIAAVPHPGRVTYEDHVVAVHLTDIEGHPGKEALVYMLAMAKRQLLPAANLRAGDRMTLTLENWSRHEAVEGAFNRSELDSDITFLAEPLWAMINEK